MSQEKLNKEQYIKQEGSEAEKIVRAALENIINTKEYAIESQCSLSATLNIEQKSLIEKYQGFCKLFYDISPEENANDLSITHFDIVIAKKDNDEKIFEEGKLLRPVLIIEVNGSYHLTEPRKRFMDSFKLAISQSKLIPFITIPLYKPYEDNIIGEIVTNAIEQINVKKAIPVYCPICKRGRLGMHQNSATKENFWFCPVCKNTKGNNKTFDYDKICPCLLKVNCKG